MQLIPQRRARLMAFAATASLMMLPAPMSLAQPDVTTYTYDATGNRILVEGEVAPIDPAIVAIEPLSAPPGQRINLYGRNLPWQDRAATLVLFNGEPAPVIRMSERVITVEVPAGATSGPLQVVTPGNGVIDAGDFVVRGIVVTPTLARVGYGEAVQFNADVFGVPGGVSWQVTDALGNASSVGTIDEEGLYTAPGPTSSGEFPFIFEIEAAGADGLTSGSATVTTGCDIPDLIAPLGIEGGEFGTTPGLFTACYEFDANANSAATIVLSSNRTMRLALVGPNLQTLVSDQRSSFRWRDVRLPQTGTYTLLVGSRDTNDLTYTIGLSDQFVETLPAVQLDAPILGEIVSHNDVDDHPISLTAGQLVTAQADWLSGQTSVTNPISVALIDAVTRVPVARSLPGSAPDPLGARIVDVVVPATGEYLLQVSATGTGTGEQFSYRLTADAPGVDIMPIAFGQARSGFLQGASIDCWDFQGQAGDVVTLSATGNSPSIRYQLIGPTGFPLDFIPVVDASYRRAHMVLAESGTYRFMVRPDQGRATPYIVGLSDEPTESLGVPAFGATVQGSLDPYGDVDEYPITLSAGDRVGAASYSSNGRDITLSVLDANGTLVAGGNNGRTSAVTGWTVPAGGDYRLRLISPGIANPASGYELAVDSASAEIIPISPGATAAVPIEGRSDLQTVEFEASAGDTAWLSIDPGVPADFALIDPAGAVLRSASQAEPFRWEEIRFEAGGTHRLVIESGAVAPAQALVGLSDQLAVAPLPIGLGSSESGELFPFGDVDEFGVTLAEGQIVSAAGSANQPIQLRLLDASTRTLLAIGSPPGSGSPNDSGFAEIDVPATGPYILQVVSRDADPASVPVSYTVLIDALGDDTRGLAFGEVETDTLGGTESQDWTFTVPAGSFASLSASGNAGLIYRLLGPGGEPVDPAGVPGPVYRRFDLPAGMDTTYTLRVTAPIGQGGGYTLALSDQPTETPRALAFGVQTLETIDPFGDVDEFTLDVIAGQPVTLSVNWLEPADGQALAFGSDSARVRILAEGRTVEVPGSAGFGSDPRDSRVLSWIPGVTETVLVQVYGERIDPRNRFRYLIRADEN